MSKVMVLSNPHKRKKHRNPESRSERSRAAKRGWAHRRRHRNPESRSERRRAAELGWRRRRHRNPESRSERARAAKRGWAHRRRHRNPIGGEVGAVLMPAIYGAGAAIGLNILLGYLTFLPTSLQSGYGRTGVQLAAALGIGALGPKMGLSRRTSNSVAAGIALIAVYDVASTFIASKFPNVNMGENFTGVNANGIFFPPGTGMGELFTGPGTPGYAPQLTVQSTA